VGEDGSLALMAGMLLPWRVFWEKPPGVGGFSGPTSCDTSQCLFFLEFKVEKITEK